MKLKKVYYITPIGKPRMTQRDKWRKRKIVRKYYQFKDQIWLNRVALKNSGQRITFVLPLPKSWSQKKKKQFDGTPHQAKPDIDNLLKALFDTALLSGDDKDIYEISTKKIWGKVGMIIIEDI